MFLNVLAFNEPTHSYHFSDLEQLVLASGVGRRLFAACLLGGAIGIEREYHNAIEGAVLQALDSQGKRLFEPERDTVAQTPRISFSVLGTRGQHKVLMAALRESPVVGRLLTFHDAEDE